MLTIALEPEAAAIFFKHLPVDRRLYGEGGDLFKTFAPDSKYIIVDAGGMYARIWLRQGVRHWPFPTVLEFHYFSIQVILGGRRGVGSGGPSSQLFCPLSTLKPYASPMKYII